MNEQIISNLKVKIFADGADIQSMKSMNENPLIKGLTTNPTLMKKAGITDYKEFARDVLKFVELKPISFEVFSDDFEMMKKQALEISTWGENVYVKIPITNTLGESSRSLIRELSERDVKINVTAILTSEQVREVIECLNPEIPNYISIFAGRIADTGRDPVSIVSESLEITKMNPNSEIIWASPREILNVIQADAAGCHVITATTDILNKLHLLGKPLAEYSRETVEMFHNDALQAGFQLAGSESEIF